MQFRPHLRLDVRATDSTQFEKGNVPLKTVLWVRITSKRPYSDFPHWARLWNRRNSFGGALGFPVLRFWLFFRPVFGFCAKKLRFLGFGVHCGLRIFRFLAFGFRFIRKVRLSIENCQGSLSTPLRSWRRWNFPELSLFAIAKLQSYRGLLCEFP